VCTKISKMTQLVPLK